MFFGAKMSNVEIICGDEHYRVNTDDIKCSKYLNKVVCENEIVTKITLPINPEIMCMILKFIKIYNNPPEGDWISDFVSKCNDLNQLIEASYFLEINVLTDHILNMITKSIDKIETVDKVFFVSNSR